MSADNWTTCPQCAINHENVIAAAVKAVQNAYGKVSADEYLRLVEQSKNPPKLGPTLREDYELGIVDFEFYVIYTGHCETCGFHHEFKHEEPVPKKQSDASLRAPTDEEE